MAAFFRLVSPLEVEIQEEEKQQEKGCLMVMADPSDLGHGKKGIWHFTFCDNIHVCETFIYLLLNKWP